MLGTTSTTNAAEARLAGTRAELDRERLRLRRLQRRLAAGRKLLAAQLVNDYKADRPDIVSVVLGSTSFADLLERFEFIRRVQDRNARVVDRVRGDPSDTRRQAQLLTRLEREQQDRAVAVERRHASLTSMRSGVVQRQTELARARDAGAAALSGTRSGRQRAEGALRRLIARRARAAAAGASNGPWAIPWPIVQCESGGQNLPPNRAGVSGYYQFLRRRGAAWADRHRMHTWRRRPSRTGSRRACGQTGLVRGLGFAPNSSDRPWDRRDRPRRPKSNRCPFARACE